MKQNKFIEKLYRFLVENPEWKQNSFCGYDGCGDFYLNFNINVNNIVDGVVVEEKKYENLIADLIDGVCLK